MTVTNRLTDRLAVTVTRSACIGMLTHDKIVNTRVSMQQCRYTHLYFHLMCIGLAGVA